MTRIKRRKKGGEREYCSYRTAVQYDFGLELVGGFSVHLNAITGFDFNRFVEELVSLVAPCK